MNAGELNKETGPTGADEEQAERIRGYMHDLEHYPEIRNENEIDRHMWRLYPKSSPLQGAHA